MDDEEVEGDEDIADTNFDGAIVRGPSRYLPGLCCCFVVQFSAAWSSILI